MEVIEHRYKYQFHLPVQRQVEMLASYGLKISKSTLNHWLHKVIKQLCPLEDAIKNQLLEAGSYLFCDETSELVCVKDAKTSEMHYRKKYVWGIVNNVKKLVYYLYEEGSRAGKVIGKSLPILGDLYSQIESLYHDKLTRYSDLLRKAINYAYHEWKAVVRYIENGNLEYR